MLLCTVKVLRFRNVCIKSRKDDPYYLTGPPSHTFSKRFDCDDLAAVPAARCGHCHHPDAVFPVPTQILHLVKEFIRSSIKLAHHL